MQLDSWEPFTNAVREACPEILIQFGIAAMGLPGRKKIVHLKPDMASIALGSHDFAFVDADLLVEHSRQEIEDQVRLFNDNGVHPEFECFNLRFNLGLRAAGAKTFRGRLFRGRLKYFSVPKICLW